MVEVNRLGFTPLGHDGSSPDPSKKINIIFIHGLKGHPKKTWGRGSDAGDPPAGNKEKPSPTRARFAWGRSEAAPVASSAASVLSTARSKLPLKPFWPHEFLAEDIPEARIWTYGYNADVMEGLFQPHSTKKSVFHLGRDLASSFDSDIPGEDPVIFVAHSLGGIVLKYAIACSKQCQSRTKSIIFLGTPHRGSLFAGWGSRASTLARFAFQDPNRKLIETLRVNNEILDEIHQRFNEIVYQRGYKIHSFYEARGFMGVVPLNGKVVDDFSSKLGLPRMFETVESIDADHRRMTKFKDKEEGGYRAIRGVLRQFIRAYVVPALVEEPGVVTDEPVVTEPELAEFSEPLPTSLSKSEKGLSHDVVQSPLLMSPASQVSFDVPRERNGGFIGRTDILQKMQDMLLGPESRSALALVGDGGIGKTQVALEFAYRVREQDPDFSVFWVSEYRMLRTVRLSSSFTVSPGVRDDYEGNDPVHQLCSLLLAGQRPQDDEEKDLRDAFYRLIESQISGKYLLVLDGLDENNFLVSQGQGGSVCRWMPSHTKGRILFTTRSSQIGAAFAGDLVLQIPSMPHEEAELLFETSISQESLAKDKKTVDCIVNELDHVPSAIVQAATFMNYNTVEPAAYLEMLRPVGEDGNKAGEEAEHRRVPHPIAATASISTRHISKTNELAATVLRFITFIHSKTIPLSILPKGATPQETSLAIETLCGHGFLNRRKGESNVFDMEKLVHELTQPWAAETEAGAKAKRLASSSIVEVLRGDDAETHSMREQYLPHALEILAKSDLADDSMCELALWAGKSLCQDRFWEEGIRMLERVLVAQHEGRGGADLDRADAKQYLAMAYYQENQMARAVDLLESVVEMLEGSANEDFEQPTSHLMLALAYDHNGQPQDAIRLLERAVALQSTLADDDPDRLWSQHLLAAAYYRNGQMRRAIHLLKHVNGKTSALVEDDERWLAPKLALAIAYQESGRGEDAIGLLEEAIGAPAADLDYSFNGLLSHFALALAYLADGQGEKANELLDKAAPVREEEGAAGKALAAWSDERVLEATELLKQIFDLKSTSASSDGRAPAASDPALALALLFEGETGLAIDSLSHGDVVQEKLPACGGDVQLDGTREQQLLAGEEIFV